MKIKILVITLFITVFLANDIEDNQFKFNQSTIQAFYFIIDARIYNEPLEEGVDWIIAYHNNQCIGARKWNGPYTDIPVMGNDGGRNYAGYREGNSMQFKYYNAEEDVYYDLNPSFEYGEAIFGNETVRINGFNLIRNTENLNYSLTTRDDRAYNIYRNEELLVSQVQDNEYIDEDIYQSGNYCYEVAILDNANSEIDISEPNCITVTLGDQYSLGDVNQDLSINVSDIVLLVEWILNQNNNPLGDVNEDGSMNVSDIVLLVEWILNP